VPGPSHTPEELLCRIEEEERRAQRGRFTILLGFAAGVGKTVRMLEEGHRLQSEGKDVVVGYFEPHGRAGTAQRLRDLEVVPRRGVEYRGTRLEEIDVEAVLARRPEVVLVRTRMRLAPPARSGGRMSSCCSRLGSASSRPSTSSTSRASTTRSPRSPGFRCGRRSPIACLLRQTM
jgi:hypothetical protein